MRAVAVLTEIVFPFAVHCFERFFLFRCELFRDILVVPLYGFIDLRKGFFLDTAHFLKSGAKDWFDRFDLAGAKFEALCHFVPNVIGHFLRRAVGWGRAMRRVAVPGTDGSASDSPGEKDQEQIRCDL
jgi:hypothetical protein